MKSILALDLGSKTGWATWDSADNEDEIGTWRLVSDKEMRAVRKVHAERRYDPRVAALWERINVALDGLTPPALVVFEDVQFSVYTAQTQLWASLRSAVWLSDATLFDVCPVGTLKAFALHGQASKEDLRVVFDRQPVAQRFSTADDNAVDAFFLLYWTKRKYGVPYQIA